uniref:Uncharacterized protein n=1 Tax=Myoviridae sp. ctI7W9 TaxID=2826636 RepID=A0A8S5MP75_9CAUD|nr:MAG TPA: hypothetical protein [Myoviridae sp. ctI7W9]
MLPFMARKLSYNINGYHLLHLCVAKKQEC